MNGVDSLRVRLAIALVSAAWVRCGLAVEHTLLASDALNTTSFNTGLHWDDGQAPKAGDTYVVPSGRTLRSPITGSHTFAGDRLTIDSGCQLLLKGTDNSSLTISDFVLKGSLNNGQGNSLQKIYGNLSVPTGAAATISTGTETDRRQINVYAPLSGDGSLKLNIPRRSGDMKEVQLNADNSGFTGPVTIVGKGKLTITGEANLGGNPSAWNPRQFTMNGSVLRAQSSLTLDDPNRGIWLSNMTVTATDVYPGGRFEIGGGLTATIACVIGGEGPFEKTDLGLLILMATNTCTGASTVSAGTLLINSPTNATASLSVAAGAALGGTGTVHCAVTVASGGSIALAGNGYGTFTLADAAGLSLDSPALSFDAQAAADGPTDCLALSGPLTLSGAGTVSVRIPDVGLPAGTYTLVSYPSHSGDGTLTMTPPFPNAALVLGETAITLEVAGSGATRDMVWKGNASDNTWAFAAGNWWPEDAPFFNGVDVRFDDAGVASVPVTLASDAAPRDINIAATNNAYTLSTDAYALTARDVTKYGNAVLTLRGDQRVSTLTVGYDTGSGFVGGGAVTLDALLTVGGGVTVRPTAGTFTQAATSVIAGDGHLTLGSTANLSGTNTFAGTTTVGYVNNTKNITLYSDGALGATSGGTVLRGGTSTGYNKLIVGNGVTVTDEPLTITGGSGYRAGLWSVSGGASAWDGNITVASDGQLQIGSGSGNTFTVGSLGRTVITNAGTVTVSFRDSGTTVLNSRLAMPSAGISRDDSGTLVIRSPSNVVSSIAFLQGNIVLEVEEPFASTPSLSIGKNSDTNPANKSTLNLNGHSVTLGRITDAHGDAYNGTPNEGYQRILCTAPSRLTVDGSSASSYARVGSIMSGPLTLIKTGTATFTLGQTNAFSGAFVLSNGVFAVTASGSLGTGATNVVVAGGTLSLSNDTALCAAANVTFSAGGSGVIDLPAGVDVKVYTLWYGEDQKYAGTYGSGVSGARYKDDSRFSGAGVLTVAHGNGGTAMLIQ